MKDLILIGANLDLIEFAEKLNYRVLGLIDNLKANDYYGYEILGDDSIAEEILKKYPHNDVVRERVSLSLMDEGHRFVMIETRNDVDDGTEKQLVRYQLHNHLGSAALELDGTAYARVISYEEYHPFGTTAYQAKNKNIKSAAKRYRYTGMERDEETGFEYHSARYYLPWLGRWLSADPIGIGDGVNVYAYLIRNPLVKIDSKGTNGESLMYDIRIGTTVTFGSSNIEITHSLSANLSGIFNSGFGGEVGGKVEFYNSDKKYGVDLPASGINFSVFARVQTNMR